MLWSVMPENIVFEGIEAKMDIREQDVNSRRCLVRTGNDGRCYIEGICSTEPKDYLDETLYPGRQIGVDGDR